jgi:hypothetical protein
MSPRTRCPRPRSASRRGSRVPPQPSPSRTEGLVMAIMHSASAFGAGVPSRGGPARVSASTEPSRPEEARVRLATSAIAAASRGARVVRLPSGRASGLHADGILRNVSYAPPFRIPSQDTLSGLSLSGFKAAERPKDQQKKPIFKTTAP